jgi:hypothetical protein
MGLEFVDMDDKKQYTNYKKKKRHEKFVRENTKATNTEPSYEADVDPEPEKEITSTELCGKVIKIDQLRVRNYPEGDIIRMIKRDTEVEIISEHDDIWYKVRLADGTVGFCMKEYLQTYVNGEIYGLNDSRRCKTWPTL